MAEVQPIIPSGFCQCGCGSPTEVYKRTYRRLGRVKGKPMRFLPGHSAKRKAGPPPGWNPGSDGGLPPGVCQCGCGQATKVATANNRARGYRKGEYRPFVVGHGLHRKRDEEHASPVRTCRICKVQRPVAEFKLVCGVPIWTCRPCEVERVRKWNRDNPGHKRDMSLRGLFGIGLDDYERMLAEQGGACAICRRPESMIDPRTNVARNLAVDHCHETGAVRGLLCGYCNKALGGFGDNPDRLRAAVEYLERER